MEYIVSPKLWDIHCSLGFLKRDIHPAPDIPSCDHGCFVMFPMPKGAHDDASVVQKLGHRNALAGIQSGVTCASFSGSASNRTAATQYTPKIQDNYFSLVSFSKILHWRK